METADKTNGDRVEAHKYVVKLLGELFVEQIVERSSTIRSTNNSPNKTSGINGAQDTIMHIVGTN